MIKILLFRKNFLQTGSVKVPTEHRRSSILNLPDRVARPINNLLKKINTSNLATMYAVGIIEPSLSVIHQLKLAVDTTEKKLIRAGFYLINPRLVLCIKVQKSIQSI